MNELSQPNLTWIAENSTIPLLYIIGICLIYYVTKISLSKRYNLYKIIADPTLLPSEKRLNYIKLQYTIIAFFGSIVIASFSDLKHLSDNIIIDFFAGFIVSQLGILAYFNDVKEKIFIYNLDRK